MSSEPVIHLDAETLLPVGVSVPCPARIEGPFLGSDATFVQCGQLVGHDGPHVAHIEWTNDDLPADDGRDVTEAIDPPAAAPVVPAPRSEDTP